MPQLNQLLTIDITPEKFLRNCSREELIELDLLLQSNAYQEKMNPIDDQDLLERNFNLITD